jgi:N-acyl-D-amino-acid deacylase
MNANEQNSFDVVFENCRIVDGTGNPWYTADVALRGDKIVGIGVFRGTKTKRRVDASGKVLCPGFIDTHSHSDVLIFANPAHDAKVRQGVTTEILGQDGISCVPMRPNKREEWARLWAGMNGEHEIPYSATTVDEYLDKFEGRTPVNVAYLVPHGNLRFLTVGMDDRPASKTEMEEMQLLLEQGLTEGAVGLSTGLSYVPACYSETEEITALCNVLRRFRGVHVSHIRSYGSDLREAIDEVLTVARETGAPIHFSHYTTEASPVDLGKADELLAIIDQARANGVDATLDFQAYTGGSGVLHAHLPQWLADGGIETMANRLRSREVRKRLEDEYLPTNNRIGTFILAGLRTRQGKSLEGKTIAQAVSESKKPLIEFICDLLLQEDFNVTVVEPSFNEKDIEVIVQSPYHMVSTDALLPGSKPHPRTYGTYPRYLGYFVREQKTLKIEDAIRKMTYFPAQRFGFQDRGIIREGMAADLVLFDPDVVCATATFAEPQSFPLGIEMVLVNGKFIVDNGERTDALPGRALRRPKYHPTKGKSFNM